MLAVYEPVEMAVVKVFNDAVSNLSSEASLPEVEPDNCVGVPGGAGEEATVVLGVYITEGTTVTTPVGRALIAEEIRPPPVARSPQEPGSVEPISCLDSSCFCCPGIVPSLSSSDSRRLAPASASSASS